MTKEDKQLKKEFDKEFLDIKRLDCGRLTTYKKEFKKELNLPDKLWNWINKYYVSKKWVEKELIGEGVDGYGGNNKEEYNKCLNRNEFRQEQRNKLKEKNEK
jgi:hypothetical protein